MGTEWKEDILSELKEIKGLVTQNNNKYDALEYHIKSIMLTNAANAELSEKHKKLFKIHNYAIIWILAYLAFQLLIFIKIFINIDL